MRQFRFTTLFTVLILTLGCKSEPEKKFDIQLQKIINQDRFECKAPALAVSIQGPNEKNIYDYFDGTTNFDGSRKIKKESLFQIGSITKSFTAAIILQLEFEKKLILDAPIGGWLPQYSQWKSITVKQLLNQTSGIYNYSDISNFKNNLIKKPTKQFALKELADLAYNHKKNLLFYSGKGWAYSNTNYVLLGLIIEKITGHSFSNEISSRLLGKKFGLLNTYYIKNPKNSVEFLVHSYDGAGKNSPTNTDVTIINTSWAGPAGGLISSAHDIVLWAKALFKGNVLQPKQLNEMTTLVSMESGQLINKQSENGYGLGIGSDIENFGFNKKYGLVYDHTGGMLGALSYFVYLPRKNIIVAVVTNTNQCDVIKIADDVISSVIDH